MAKVEQHQQLELPVFDSEPHILIVAAPYQKLFVDLLVEGAMLTLDERATAERVDVPGALEIAPAIKSALRSGKFDGFVALGCIVRGDTTHYDTVCAESARGLTSLNLEEACIGNGILTVENEEQALQRADPEDQDKGGEAAAAALHLLAVKRQFRKPPSDIGFKLESDSDGNSERTAGKKPQANLSRRVSRLRALQALFQMEATSDGIEKVKREFESDWLSCEDIGKLAKLDKAYFRKIVETAVNEQKRIDKLIHTALKEGWPIDRIDPTLRALFRSAGAELVLKSAPKGVIINEFVEITKAFYPDGKAASFVNGMLDQMATLDQLNAQRVCERSYDDCEVVDGITDTTATDDSTGNLMAVAFSVQRNIASARSMASRRSICTAVFNWIRNRKLALASVNVSGL